MFIILFILQDLFKVYPSLKSFINFKFYISHRDNALVDVDRVEERLLQVEFNYRLKSPMGIYKTLPKINILSKGKLRFLFNCMYLLLIRTICQSIVIAVFLCKNVFHVLA